MKRLGLIGFVCLCLQMSAVSAPFVHLHADAAHETDHHDGRVVHYHAAGHAFATAHHHDQDESAADRRSSVEAPAPVDVSTEPTVLAGGAPKARPSLLAMSLAPAQDVVEITQPSAPVTRPPDDIGRRPSGPADPSTSSLRGPPC